MTLEFFVLLTAGALSGGFINRLAGFGTSLLALIAYTLVETEN